MQLFANTAVTGLSMNNCAEKPWIVKLFGSLWLSTVWGFSGCVTTILAHRYLLERAGIMVSELNYLQPEINDSRIGLARLGSSFKWEVRVLMMLPVFMIVNPLAPDLAYLLSFLAILGLACIDLVFTVVVQSLFLRPILHMLRLGKGGGMRTFTRRMQTMKYEVVFGSGISVVSSTLLYINCLVFLMRSDYFENRGSWALHPLIFGFNLDSILNDVGMLLVCGIFRHAACSKPKTGDFRGDRLAENFGRGTAIICIGRS